jgi:acyl carrier protein
MPSNIEPYGDTSTATIPILMGELLREGRIVCGQLAVSRLRAPARGHNTNRKHWRNNVSQQQSEIVTRMKEVIREQLDVQPDVIAESASFVDDLGADSLALVELVLAMEEEFGISIPDADTERLRTVGDAIAYVQTHLDSSAA